MWSNLEHLNQVFPRGALFLAATDAEFKHLLMELTTELFQEVQGTPVCSTRTIGRNDHAEAGDNNDANTLVLSPTVTISSSGVLMQPENAPVLWLERPTSSSNSTNLLLNESLARSIVTPLARGRSTAEVDWGSTSFHAGEFDPYNGFNGCQHHAWQHATNLSSKMRMQWRFHALWQTR